VTVTQVSCSYIPFSIQSFHSSSPSPMWQWAGPIACTKPLPVDVQSSWHALI